MKEHMSQTGYEGTCHNQEGKGHVSQTGRGGGYATSREGWGTYHKQVGEGHMSQTGRGGVHVTSR